MAPDTDSTGEPCDPRDEHTRAERGCTRTDDERAAQWRSLVSFATALTGDPPLGEDLAQIAFTELVTTDSEVRDESAWLRTVVVHRAKNHWRSLGRERNALLRVASRADDRSGFPGPGQCGPDGGSTGVAPGDLARVIEALPPRQRAAVLLVYGEDRSTQEAARILDCAPATLRVHLHRARKRLRRALVGPQQSDDDDGPADD